MDRVIWLQEEQYGFRKSNSSIVQGSRSMQEWLGLVTGWLPSLQGSGHVRVYGRVCCPNKVAISSIFHLPDKSQGRWQSVVYLLPMQGSGQVATSSVSGPLSKQESRWEAVSSIICFPGKGSSKQKQSEARHLVRQLAQQPGNKYFYKPRVPGL